ncbi:hypothetical protein [Massilia sp. Root335]|uniref:hypothetical protein n=1 Tax=Massilia sp. Root335 TaxID=1736517 RepID=UPI000AC9B0D4|nr:hypothetical protein [Massilia sp. Root335]
MAKSENLDKAYMAIGSLLASGVRKLSVEKVRVASGLARQTFYQEDEDWLEVRAVINGKPSDRVKLVQVEIKKKSETERQLDSLFERIETMEQEVARLEGTASQVYKELIDEIQRWFYKASENPKRNATAARHIEELNSMRQEMDRLTAENRLLRARESDQDTVKILSHKKVIELKTLAEPGDIFDDFLKQYKSIVSTPSMAALIRGVYVLCGLPCSGKSNWIKAHKPPSSGLHIYVDSCAHQTHIRRFIAKQVAVSDVEIHCVWLRNDKQACLERSAAGYAGAAKIIKQEEINFIAENFQDPSLAELFDSVILVSKDNG